MSLTTDTPGGTPPQTSRLENMFPPEYISANRGPVAEGVAWTFLFLQIVFVVLRFISRRHIKAKLGLDDWLILPGLLFCVGMCIVTISRTHSYKSQQILWLTQNSYGTFDWNGEASTRSRNDEARTHSSLG